MELSLTRLALIVAVAIVAHLTVVGIQALGRRMLESRGRSKTKIHTVTGFVSSLLVFAIYFGAVGFCLTELGVSLTTYLASASVIGLAVSFGSQGVVQDVITGLTVVFSDLLDVGDMVDIGGQVGIVEAVGMRFTVLTNFSGARVYVPNRSIGNVVNYPQGYVRAYVDARLPADGGARADSEGRLIDLAQSAYEQYPGILLLPPTIERRPETRAGYRYLRIKFRIWPGQAAIFENAVKSALVQAMKDLDPAYADWMVTIHYRSEPPGEDPDKRLPRPSAVRARRDAMTEEPDAASGSRATSKRRAGS